MSTITVKNLSTFTDCAALSRVAQFIAGDENLALYDSSGNKVVKINSKRNVYTILDEDGTELTK